jgi:uncharacterized protein (TIGR00369 family)
VETTSLSRCFGCGKDNPIGFRLEKSYRGEKSYIEFKVGADYCGHPGILHGGVISLLFDEVMFYAAAKTSKEIVTVGMNVAFKNPAYENHTLICEAWITKENGKMIEVDGIIHDQETKKTIAKAQAQFLEIDLKRFLKK